MLRILGKISVFGSADAINQLANRHSIPNSNLQQVGLGRRIPDVDSWCFSSPWYRFRVDSLDEDVCSFLDAHEGLAPALAAVDTGVTFAVFTLAPVGQTEEEVFSGVLSALTLSKLSHLRLSLEIAPASVMPDVPYWK